MSNRKRRVWLALVASASLAAQPARAIKVDPKADVHPTAVLMGNVTVGAYTKIGPKVVIQGEVAIGHHVNILGNAVISAEKGTIGNYVRIDYGAKVVGGRGIGARTVPDQLYIRDNCWVGMNATVRGSRMEEGSAVGNGAVADFNTHLEKGAVLAHGAVTTHDLVIPANALAEGIPAKITKQAATDADRQRILGLIPSQWIHHEHDRIAAAIDKNPPQVRDSYPGIDCKQYWRGEAKIDPTAKVHPTAIFNGKVTIGAHTRIGPGVIISGGAVGHHSDIRANTNIRGDIVIGNYCYVGERVHVASSRTGGFDDPLWIKDYSYVSPGSVVHATKIDDHVYYGANVTTDYGDRVEPGAVLSSGAMVFHDSRIRAEAVVEGNPGLMDRNAGIPDERRMALIGFLPQRWIAEAMGPALERSETYETPLRNWEHANRGTVKGTVEPGATLVGNVNVGEGARIFPGAYIEGNVTIGKRVDIVVDVMIISNGLTIGEHTHIYDKAMIVDGRPAETGSTTNRVADAPRIGIFCWINHLAALQGAWLDDFSLANIGASAAFGTRIGREALLLNGAATYADQRLPARSISYGVPAKVRVMDSTMRERMVFFYGRDWPTWERQATPEELKNYRLPE
jgi:carbonic anhydrase/acetyltransferase-like protein (isoleucine patch superfamily)